MVSLHTSYTRKWLHIAAFLFLFFPALVRAQLADFTFDVAVTAETCAGNGTMTFTTSGTTPGATIEYIVYLEPDVTTPVATTTDAFLDGRIAGNYTVVALQTLGDQTNMVTVQVEIESLPPEPLLWTPVAQAQNCPGGNRIVINVTSGTATLYEIIDVAPPQTSNIFTNLIDGMYNIRVYDECGQGTVTTFTAVFDAQPPIFSDPIVEEVLSGDCANVSLTNSISYPEGTILSYPLVIEYVIHPSDGSPDIVSSQTINSGDPASVVFSHTFPYAPGVTYTYVINVENGCGNTYNSGGNTFNPAPEVTLVAVPIPCGKYYFTLNASGYNPPYTVNFSSVPSGFNPVAFNTTYPGTYDQSSIIFGGEDLPVPEGTYIVTITDVCNRISEPYELLVEYDKPTPNAAGYNNGCFSDIGRIIISIPNRNIVSATITLAPGDYAGTLPDDVSDLINSSGTLVVTNIPLGDYLITLIDDCGVTYIDVPVNVPPYSPQGFAATALADCGASIGAVTVSSGNGKLVTLTMTAAPASFTEPLPYNVTAFIDPITGKMYLDNLPQGTYSFSGTDVCGIEGTIAVNITGYVPDPGITFTFLPHCNSFDIDLQDDDASSLTPTYWLQKENPAVPGEWGHPDTGVAYTEGTLPTNATAIHLQNHEVNINFQYFGNFRILKIFETVASGQDNKICASPIGDTFEYYYDVTINNVYTLGCASSPDDVYIEATGLAPLNYSIVDQDTNAVLFDNGTNSVFSGLAAGVYKFKVENSCGAFKTIIKDITQLPDLVNAYTPPDLPFCVQPGESLFVETDLTQQNPAILNGVSADIYTITFYLTQNDADLAQNVITDPQHFVNTLNPQTIYVRMDHNLLNICHDIVQFQLEVGTSPDLNVTEQQFLCEVLGELTLSAGPGFDSYLWLPGGETTPEITVTQPGDYTIRVTTSTTISTCPAEATITVLPVAPPEIISIDTFDWTENDNGFTVNINNPQLYEYSVDNVNYQLSNTITGLAPGIYNVFVRDRQQCSMIQDNVVLLNYPKFFTPNGDGQNETWRIQYSWLETGMMVFVYDRFGKLITSLAPDSPGWDGTLNGARLPATDYWFVANREDGRIYKGHFSLLR